jgi:hypothetical protein
MAFNSLRYGHSWASASRILTPASAFRHTQFHSGIGPKKKCRTASAGSSTAPVPASLVFSFRYRTDRMLDSPAFWHLYTWKQTRTPPRTPPRTHTHTHTRMYVCTYVYNTNTYMYMCLKMCGMTMDRNIDVHHEKKTWTWTYTMDLDIHQGMP